MGTEVTVLLDAPDSQVAAAALADVETTFRTIESLCTRFSPDSALSRLNEAGAGEVPELLAEVVRAALTARESTAGLFDPTVHDAVVAAGYSRSFSELEGELTAPGFAPACGGDARVEGTTVELAPGVRLDLGGIAKGFAVDLAVERLAPLGPCLVDAGGDIAVRGTWPVAVDGGPTLELVDAAIATSGRDRRRWRLQDGSEAHHLIDPATGRPAATSTLRATVVAGTATEAEVAAKAAFLRGTSDVPHVIVRTSGEVVIGGGIG
ncbi:MAG: FAD:protein FMN transferase [Gaiellales bacterium]